MSRAESFLALFRKLEDHLHKISIGKRGIKETRPSFFELLEEFRKEHGSYRWTVEKLKDFGDLRNAIVHHRDRREGIIAEPTEEALREFEELVKEIVSPPKLTQFLCHTDRFSPDDPLVTVLSYMREHDYSQVAVQSKEGKLSLLTVEGIARWLEEKSQEDSISMQEARVADAQRYEKTETVFLNRNNTIYDAKDMFMFSIEKKKPRLYALLITENGKSTEKPLGIVTPWDLLNDKHSK